MATVVIEESTGIDIETFDGAAPTFSSIGGGTGAAIETVTFYEGTQSASRKVTSSSDAGYRVTVTSQNLTTAGNEVLMGKVLLTDGSDLNAVGFKYRVDSGNANNYYYLLIHNSNKPYPTVRSWLIAPWDTSLSGYRSLAGTAPTMTGITQIGLTAALTTGGAKSENLFLDAIQYGRELYCTRGDSTDPDADWTFFLDYDEGGAGTGIASTSNRIGHVISADGILFPVGGFVIGRTAAGSTANPTVFQDTGSVVVFPNTATDTGWNFIEADITNASTDIDFNNGVYQGKGNGAAAIYFDTGDTANTPAGDIDATNDRLRLNITGAFEDATPVTYSNADKNGTAGTTLTGLTNNTQYWISESSVAGEYFLYTSREDAINNDGATGLQALPSVTVANAEEHNLTIDHDTRPQLTVTGTGGAFNATGCTFDAFGDITFTSAATITSCIFTNSEQITQSNASIDSCTISGATTTDGEAFIVSNDLNAIQDCTFTYSKGHGIEITAGSGTITFSGNTFTGYNGGANNDYTDSDFAFNTETDVASDIITLTGDVYTTGDAVYYIQGYAEANKTTANTETIGLTNTNLYYVNRNAANNFYLYDTEVNAVQGGTQGRVTLTASGAGNGEEQFLYPADAAIYNNTGNAITISVTNGSSPSVRDSATSTTTVEANVNLTITVQDADTNPIQGAVVAIYNSTTDALIVNDETDVNGDVTASAAASQPVYIRVRKSTTGSTRYVPVETVANTGGAGFALTITLAEDLIVSA